MYDTLVAKDMSEANRVAFGGRRRWRVVTLDGKLVDTSGTMSGGGHRVFRGAMRLSSAGPVSGGVSEHDLRKLVKTVEVREAQFEEAARAFNEMETNLNEFKDRQPQIEIELSKLEVERKSLEDESNDMRKL
ncbi:unnamed protein product [Ambrosiozyma monospora]|uniref:Unnamed protein product n=1 Tax=Ambrosiozyma monospora TaxID=43982 RepID=A0ACB5UD45_AMBMO|nr:unnamed protein product [Ambrosiozyma monospora]